MENTKILALIIGALLMIIGLVVAFNMIGNSGDTIKDASYNMQYGGTNCTVGQSNVNWTDVYCYNTTARGGGRLYAATTYSLPFSSLFSPTSVVVMFVMAGFLLMMVFWVMKKRQS